MKRFPWMSLALCALAATSALLPAAILEYDRARVAGEPWRLLTGQMIHWTARMALFDLGLLIAIGIWLEARGDRRIAIAALGLGTALTASAVHVLSPDLQVYRGSSGAASAFFMLATARLAAFSDRWSRVPALAAMILFLAKAAFEALTGYAIFAGPLPPGVAVVPLVHLLGGLGGLAAARRSPSTLPPTSPAVSQSPRRSWGFSYARIPSALHPRRDHRRRLSAGRAGGCRRPDGLRQRPPERLAGLGLGGP